jgi:XTP/dITP diphosphohydrolase
MHLTFVSTNEGKFREVRSILADYGVRVHWKRQPLPEVQASRLESVVEAKLGAAERLGRRVLVEDSGLFIPSLGGFPGVYSAYVLNTIGLEGLLRLVRGRERHATFLTVAGLSVGRRRWLRRGECVGRIADRPQGGHGFGYDPIFIADGETRTFGQLAPSEKNRWSHRARAIHRVGRLLRSFE